MAKHSKTKWPTLNPDGTSVKGCIYIYAPRGKPVNTRRSRPIHRGCGQAAPIVTFRDEI